MDMNAFSCIDCTPELSVALGRRGEELTQELRLASALKLFELGRISSGLAATLAGMPRVEFLQQCGDYGVSIFQVTPEDLEREVAAAIALAVREKADWILLDDLAARSVAEELGLKVIGTLGILMTAHAKGILESAYESAKALQDAGFRVSKPILDMIKAKEQ